jgi:hypothetical protein
VTPLLCHKGSLPRAFEEPLGIACHSKISCHAPPPVDQSALPFTSSNVAADCDVLHVQVPIAVWVIQNAELRSNRLYGTHPLSHWMLCIAGGFFLHDAISCYFRESPFYIIHGLTCCLGYTLGAAYSCGHFYGGLFLMWECSTPFVQLRWVLFKMGRSETTLYRINGILMVISFGIARIFFGTCAIFNTPHSWTKKEVKKLKNEVVCLSRCSCVSH